MKPGETLQVMADCPMSFQTVPQEAKKHGYEIIREPEKRGQDLYFWIHVPRT